MSAGLILFVGLIYTVIAIRSALEGNGGMAIAFAGYAFSNLGLAHLARQ